MAKVLVVEDDNNLREIYETSLKAEGYETAAAADGMEALESATRSKPDLIISDVMMPRLSGFEMLEKLRQDENLKDVPVIMMTALSMAEDKETAKRLGVVHYLVKSQVTLEDFVNVAKKFVPADGSSGSSTTSTPTTPPEEPTVAPSAPATAPTTPAPEPTPASEQPVPIAQTTTTQVTPPPTEPSVAPSASPPADPASDASQSTSQETSAVEAQIQNFIASQPTDSPQPAVKDEASSADDKQGKKVIEPLGQGEKKDINELAKAEEAKENEPPKNPPSGSSVDPNSIAL